MYTEFVTELSHPTSEIRGSQNGIDDDSNILGVCAISGFRRVVNEIFALLGCYAA